MKNSNDSSPLGWIIATVTLVFLVFCKDQIKIILEIISRNINLPFSFYVALLDKFRIPLFYGLQPVSKTTDASDREAKIVIYANYKAAKSVNLIGSFGEPILSETAYNSKKAITFYFLEKCRHNTINDLSFGNITFDINCPEISEFDLLIKVFEAICGKYITSSEARLFIHCAGAVFGATYEDRDYSDLVCIASKMTVENERLLVKDNIKLDLLINILEELIYSKVNKSEFDVSVKFEIDEYSLNRSNTKLNAIDIKIIVYENLIKTLQSFSLSK